MPEITKETGRQDTLVGKAEGTFADVTDDTYMAAVDVPGGAIITGGFLAITTLFNSATDDKFSIGTKVGSASANKTALAALSADITAAGTSVPIVPTGYQFTEPGSVGVVWNGSGAAPSAGAFMLVVEYIKDGRAHSSQG
jgi:hypothetical protein